MSRIKLFVSGILAGVCIAIGGTVYLSLDNKVLGALFFTVGLFTICVFGLHLFTGKVCYVFEKDGRYALDLPIIWLGNFVGTLGTAGLERLTRIGASISEKAVALCDVKFNDSFLSIFILAVFCNILIYIAVEGYGKNPHEIGKYLSLFFGVMVFILCGFEHCIADMYYFSLAEAWTRPTAWLYILGITFGNAAGGVLLPLLRGWINKSK